MRRWLVMLSLVAVVGFAVAQDDVKPKTKAQPKAKKPADDSLELEADPNALGKKPANKKELFDKLSYAMGREVGLMRQKTGIEIDPKRVIKGMEDALKGADPEFTDEELTKAYKDVALLQRSLMAKVGEDFLAANKEKEGVKSLPSGVQYKVHASGKGASPKANDTVKVHYKGKLIDGKVFDGSYTGEAPTKRDKPTEMPMGRLTKGFKEALTKMKPGDKWTVYIPSELAYGETGAGQSIPPHAVVIFDLELIEIVE